MHVTACTYCLITTVNVGQISIYVFEIWLLSAFVCLVHLSARKILYYFYWQVVQCIKWMDISTGCWTVFCIKPIQLCTMWISPLFGDCEYDIMWQEYYIWMGTCDQIYVLHLGEGGFWQSVLTIIELQGCYLCMTTNQLDLPQLLV